MASESIPIDISDEPALLRLAEELHRTNEPRALRRAGEDLAVLMPIRPTAKHRASRVAVPRRSPTPEWGSMLGEGRHYILISPNMATFPGLAIFLTVLGFNLAGDGLRDALDPSLRGR
jgi:hypothetical protein